MCFQLVLWVKSCFGFSKGCLDWFQELKTSFKMDKHQAIVSVLICRLWLSARLFECSLLLCCKMKCLCHNPTKPNPSFLLINALAWCALLHFSACADGCSSEIQEDLLTNQLMVDLCTIWELALRFCGRQEALLETESWYVSFMHFSSGIVGQLMVLVGKFVPPLSLYLQRVQ